MRGRNFPDTVLDTVYATLMARYNQPYSEIENIPLKTSLFLLRLAEAEDQYIKQKVEQAKMKNKGRKI